MLRRAAETAEADAAAARVRAAAGDVGDNAAEEAEEELTLFLEDDVRLRPDYEAALATALSMQPPASWDVLLATGGGTPPALRGGQPDAVAAFMESEPMPPE